MRKGGIRSNPAEVPYGYGPYTGLRVLAVQEDTARRLVLALDAKRQAIAIVAPNPRGFASGTTVKFDPQTPVGLPMSQMTAGQRDMLMKLIDRETGKTTCEIVKQMRGGFQAAMWQTLARIFGHNLKTEYDARAEDLMIERAIKLVESGRF